MLRVSLLAAVLALPVLASAGCAADGLACVRCSQAISRKALAVPHSGAPLVAGVPLHPIRGLTRHLQQDGDETDDSGQADDGPTDGGHDSSAQSPSPSPSGNDSSAQSPSPSPSGNDSSAQSPSPSPQNGFRLTTHTGRRLVQDAGSQAPDEVNTSDDDYEEDYEDDGQAADDAGMSPSPSPSPNSGRRLQQDDDEGGDDDGGGDGQDEGSAAPVLRPRNMFP